MTPIERAARALWQDNHDAGNWVADSWEEATNHDQNIYRRRVRAVLTAIREPSEGMLSRLLEITDDRDLRMAMSTDGLTDEEAARMW